MTVHAAESCGLRACSPGTGSDPGAPWQDGAPSPHTRCLGCGSVLRAEPQNSVSWLLTLTRVRQSSVSFTRINSFSPLLEKQDDKTQTKPGMRWFWSHRTAAGRLATLPTGSLRPTAPSCPFHYTHTSEEGVRQPVLSRGAGRQRAGSGPDTRVWNSWFLPSQVASCLAPLVGLGTWRTRGQGGTWPGIAGHRRPESPAQRK